MKAPVCLAVAILQFIFSFAQNDSARRDLLLSRSESLRTSGYVTVSLGCAAFVTGIGYLSRVDGGLEDLDKGLGGSVLVLVGTGCMVAGMFNFINSNNLLKKANRISVKLNEPVVINTGFEKRVLPYSVGIGIPIN